MIGSRLKRRRKSSCLFAKMLAETCQRQDAADPENRGVWLARRLWAEMHGSRTGYIWGVGSMYPTG